MARAIKGGQVGANGEFYKGGRFLNTIAENPKVEGSKPKTARKVEIEPYKWVVPEDGRQAIYPGFAGVFGKVINGQMIVNCSDQTLAYFGKTREAVQAIADRYNNGERFY